MESANSVAICQWGILLEQFAAVPSEGDPGAKRGPGDENFHKPEKRSVARLGIDGPTASLHLHVG